MIIKLSRTQPYQIIAISFLLNVEQGSEAHKIIWLLHGHEEQISLLSINRATISDKDDILHMRGYIFEIRTKVFHRQSKY
jgi:hypothetical protein